MAVVKRVWGRMAGRAGALCAAAGRVAGVRGHRRGSVLVLILGALALLAVVAVVYVTVGQSDRRTGATTRLRDSVQDRAHEVGAYIADIIGQDATATFVDGRDPGLLAAGAPTDAVLVREAHDYPSTDYVSVTNLGPNNPAPANIRFSAAGSYDTPWAGNGADLRTPSDPWLAATEPTWLLGPSGAAASTVPATNFSLRIDWSQFSNIGPSGNPVNLYNIRGNFDADPGFSANPFNPPAGAAHMSDRLTLFDPASPSGPASRVITLGFDPGRNADPLRPAHWTTYQVGAFRPDRDVDFGPEDRRYLHYQYADADGDGMLDSRWFELVDVSDPANPVSVLSKDDRFRWFVAPRIIDLSGLINVNTATDFRAAPSRTAVAGMTPADIDLLRILRLDDPGRQYTAPGGGPLSYDWVGPLLIPPGSGEPDYGNYIYQSGAPSGGAGEFGYEGLRIALRDFTVPPFGTQLGTPQLPYSTLNAPGRAEFYRRAGAQGEGASLGSFVTPAAPRTFTTGGVFGMPELLELLTFGGLNEPGAPSRLEAAVGGRFGAFQPGGNIQFVRHSPLRDNWSKAYELSRIDDNENAGRGNGLADPEALAKRVLDPRPLLTTISGGRPLYAQVVMPGFAGRLDAARDLKVDAVAALEAAAPSGTNPPQADAGKLFAAYASALLPHSWREDAWNYTIDPNRFRLAYGADPIVALWTAAHLTANAIDMYDWDGAPGTGDDHEPSAFTLAVSGDATDLQAIDTNAQSPPYLFPFWTPRSTPPPGQPLPARPGVLDLDWAAGVTTTNQIPANAPPSRLARQGDLRAQDPIAMNVFGVEAQPFIVEVASLIIYTDAPFSAYNAIDPPPANADEWRDPATTTPPGQTFPVTIDGSVNASNPDFICEVLAFQITNPFDADIELTDPQSYYYVEFGGHFFKLEKVDPTGTGGTSTVKLDGRDSSNQTRKNTLVFYALNMPVPAIQQRLDNAAPAALSGGLAGDEVRRLVERQLRLQFQGVDVDPINIPRIDATGAAATGFVDLLAGAAGQPHPDNRSVRLWRRHESANTQIGRADDLLADRLVDPAPNTGPGTLDRRWPANDRAILNTVAGRDPTNGGTFLSAEDNTGLSIMMWASIKRPDNPPDPGVDPPVTPRGAFPAYCIEPHRGELAPGQPAWTRPAGVTNFANPATPEGTGSVPRQCDFKGAPCAPERVDSVGGAFLVSAANDLVGRLIANDVLSQPDPPTNTTRTFISTWPEDKDDPGQTMPANIANIPFRRLYPEIHLNDDRFGYSSTANPPTAATLRVADMLLPMAVGPTRVPLDPAGPIDESEWITLGESMAIALGYSDPPAADPAFGFLNGFGGGPAGSPLRPRSDRGNLVLDDFAPFEDNGDGVYTPPVGGVMTDQPRWPGIPLALRVLDVFTATPREFGSIERGTPGLVNVNTAPGRVLKALPMLTPNSGMPATGGAPLWWGASLTLGTTLPDPASTDVASSVEAYRDKLEVEDVFGVPTRFDDANRANLDDPAQWSGRWETNRVQALREGRGLASIGELVCVTDNAAGPPTNRVPPQDRMDFLGREQTPTNSGAPGVDSVLYRASAGATTQTVIDGLADEFDEKLLIAAAAANTVSVRSDVFAVWFVLHGYQRSDVEGLSNTPGRADPLVPTIAKRYLMIVDRSNVTRRGDKPRILMMQELPL